MPRVLTLTFVEAHEALRGHAPARARRVARVHGREHAHGGHEAVAVCLVVEVHLRQAALEHGRDVLEPQLAHHLDDGLRHVEAAEADAVLARVVENLGVVRELPPPRLLPMRVLLERRQRPRALPAEDEVVQEGLVLPVEHLKPHGQLPGASLRHVPRVHRLRCLGGKASAASEPSCRFQPEPAAAGMLLLARLP